MVVKLQFANIIRSWCILEQRFPVAQRRTIQSYYNANRFRFVADRYKFDKVLLNIYNWRRVLYCRSLLVYSCKWSNRLHQGRVRSILVNKLLLSSIWLVVSLGPSSYTCKCHDHWRFVIFFLNNNIFKTNSRRIRIIISIVWNSNHTPPLTMN